MFKRSHALIAALAIGMAATPALTTHARPEPIVNVSKKHKKGLFNGKVAPTYGGLFGRRGANISVAQGKRNATKSRNQQRRRRALRR